MQMKLSEIAKLTGGKVVGDENQIITGVAALAEAGEGEIAFLGNMKYLQDALNSKASAILYPENLSVENFSGKNLILVSHPQNAFGMILGVIDKERLNAIPTAVHERAVVAQNAKTGKNVYIGANAVIEDNVIIGENTKIFPNVYVGANSKIGADCIIYPNVTIRENSIIGDRVILQPGVVIGGDGFGFANIGGKTQKIPQIGHVEIGDDVEIGANTTVDRATFGTTKIGKGTKTDNLAQIAHNVQIGENCFIVSQAGIAGSTKIGSNVTIGGQVGIVGHITIEDNVIVASKSGVSKDIPKGRIMSGNPCIDHREQLKIDAVTRKLPQIYADIKKLKKAAGLEDK
jgi:UDP-3-O-[3-hydroxymyristoyl] glucosamine N-acyltransferase